MTGLLNRYDVELYKKINNKEVFYFYDKLMDKELIINELNNIMNDNIENVTNFEEAMLKEAIKDIDLNSKMGIDNGFQVLIDDTIFWDVMNNFIIIIDREELHNFALMLQEECYRTYFPLVKSDFTDEKFMSETVKKC